MQLIERDGEYINANMVGVVRKTENKKTYVYNIEIDTIRYRRMSQMDLSKPIPYEGLRIDIPYQSRILRDEAFDDLIDTLKSGRSFSIDEFKEDCYMKDDYDR